MFLQLGSTTGDPARLEGPQHFESISSFGKIQAGKRRRQISMNIYTPNKSMTLCIDCNLQFQFLILVKKYLYIIDPNNRNYIIIIEAINRDRKVLLLIIILKILYILYK